MEHAAVLPINTHVTALINLQGITAKVSSQLEQIKLRQTEQSVKSPGAPYHLICFLYR